MTNEEQCYLFRCDLNKEKIFEVMKEKKLYLKYQPIVLLTTEKTVSYEALGRLDGYNPEELFYLIDALHIPEVFPYLAKQAREAMRKLKKPIYLNTTRCDIIGGMMHYPFIEITETQLLEHHIETINALSQRINVVLDDLGKDYSMWQYIPMINFSKIKFDKFLTDQLIGNKAEIYICMLREIIKWAKRHKIKTCAEGIETKEQASILKIIGCEYGQGYYFAYPQTLKELLNNE